MSNSGNGDDPFGRDGGGDWEAPSPPPDDPNIDMNYGQPLPNPNAPTQMQPQPPNQLKRTKPKLENNDIVAMVVSLFLPGVGHMMLGQTTKGIVVLIGSFVTCYGGGLVWIAVLLDCYLVAMTKKYREVGEWEFFPDANQHLKS